MRAMLFTVLFSALFSLSPSLYAASMSDADYLAAMAAMHASDTPAPSPAAVEKPAQPVTGAEVVYATVGGKEVRGYLSRPAAAKGPLPGIIVVHEWWGLNDNIRRMTDRLAGEGYEALAVDLYGAPAAKTPDEAKKLMLVAMADKDAVKDNLRQAYAYLRDHEKATTLGVIGWCFGGGWALQTALLFPDKLDAVVMYYGQPVTDVKALATLRMPLLGLFGEEDMGITVADVLNFQDALKQAGVDAEIHEYPGVGHAFANPSGQSYKPAVAKDAWERTKAFFKQHLH
ncbi:MAG TPA: dienelactone hydrolase family protein [Gammaproteobacteria bacterium]|nr:dienelactone hydrolase family protein [Gammaproteobacteria bacterium]